MIVFLVIEYVFEAYSSHDQWFVYAYKGKSFHAWQLQPTITRKTIDPGISSIDKPKYT